MIERYSRAQMKKVWSDENKFAKWLDIELAVVEAWVNQGVVPREALPKVKMARLNFKRMEELLQETHHDMTAFLGSVAESIGNESRFIHLGLTSSDIMDTATSLQLVEASKILAEDLKALVTALGNKAIEHKYTVMAGRTHGVHAEPITFGLKLALWMEETQRNRQRLADAAKIISVGKMSGAVGTYATVPPEVEEFACKKLGLSPAPISNQVIQRDRHAQFMTTMAIIAGSLEKFAVEIRALQKTEFREAEEPFAEGQTGSSAMPHKRNPELCERITGIARLVRGYAVTSLENIALWHERDISHSSTERVILPDACLVLDYALNIFTNVINGMKVFPQRMKSNMDLTRGLLFSQRVLIALIDKGMSRQTAYKVVQRNAMATWENESKVFEDLLRADEDVNSRLTQEELEELFDYRFYTRHVDDIFKRLGLTAAQWQNLSAGTEDNLAPGSL
ncbi:adenylosuccinate lyase [Dehalogenimonas lykanthroporepellens BL-DC-9]|jgi:adenylosuccinate lyase|nr:adenylosuccinate lyase [Dehalogenimonas lykanthroporepellens BL-DC-9]